MSLALQPAQDAIRAAMTLLDGPPRLLVVDDAHLADPAATRRLLLTAAALPAGSVLALGSRRPLGEPLGRLRAQRLVTELTARELALSGPEARRLLDAAGVELGDREAEALQRTTEGWPAALYLAALSRAEDPDAGFSGADRLVAEFLHDELLSGLTGEQRRFLRGTAVLSRLEAPLCDAVLETRGGARLLDELRRAGVPLTPLDRGEDRVPLPSTAGRAAARRPRAGWSRSWSPPARRAAAWHAAARRPASGARPRDRRRATVTARRSCCGRSRPR